MGWVLQLQMRAGTDFFMVQVGGPMFNCFGYGMSHQQDVIRNAALRFLQALCVWGHIPSPNPLH